MIAKNKISREVKLLACDLMWKICVLFLPLVNSRKNGDEHPTLLTTRSPVFDQVDEEVERTLVCRCVGGLCGRNSMRCSR